jgi:NADPH2:quinone reductase
VRVVPRLADQEADMRAMLLRGLDGPSSLELVDIAEPVAGPGQVLVDVHAAGVSFPELLQSQGKYQSVEPLPFVLGTEVAGVVREAPAGTGFRPGDRVAALPGTGGYQETVAVDAAHVFPLPDRVEFDVGAGLPMNYLTAIYALRHRGRIAAGEVVLVHGAGGGVGTACVQVARALGGTAIGVASSSAKAEVARRAGAAHVVPADDFLSEVRTLTSGDGVDIVADPVGGERFTDSIRSLKALGRLLVIGFTAGEIPVVKVNRLLLRNVDVVGVGFGGRGSPTYRDLWSELLPHLESGAVSTILGDVLPLELAGEALAALGRRDVAGKVVLHLR